MLIKNIEIRTKFYKLFGRAPRLLRPSQHAGRAVRSQTVFARDEAIPRQKGLVRRRLIPLPPVRLWLIAHAEILHQIMFFIYFND